MPRVHQPGMAEPKRSRRLLRRSDMSSFGVEAEVVCACSQRRPQNLVAPLTTTGQRQVPLSGSNSDNSFHVLGYTPRRRRQFGRGFQILRATTCATTPRIGVFGARRLGSTACRSRHRGGHRQRRVARWPPDPLSHHPRRQLADRGTSRSSARLWAIRNSRARSGGSSCSSSRATKAGEGILHHILGLDHVRDFI